MAPLEIADSRLTDPGPTGGLDLRQASGQAGGPEAGTGGGRLDHDWASIVAE